LRDATLRLGSTLSISNALAGTVAHLQVGDGLVLVVQRAAS
jgi:thiamine pyrophosphokinase